MHSLVSTLSQPEMAWPECRLARSSMDVPAQERSMAGLLIITILSIRPSGRVFQGSGWLDATNLRSIPTIHAIDGAVSFILEAIEMIFDEVNGGHGADVEPTWK
jgi:hypothetical protein